MSLSDNSRSGPGSLSGLQRSGPLLADFSDDMLRDVVVVLTAARDNDDDRFAAALEVLCAGVAQPTLSRDQRLNSGDGDHSPAHIGLSFCRTWTRLLVENPEEVHQHL
jgi:hypothetical protein